MNFQYSEYIEAIEIDSNFILVSTKFQLKEEFINFFNKNKKYSDFFKFCILKYDNKFYSGIEIFDEKKNNVDFLYL